jgi:hypothetical protein
MRPEGSTACIAAAGMPSTTPVVTACMMVPTAVQDASNRPLTMSGTRSTASGHVTRGTTSRAADCPGLSRAARCRRQQAAAHVQRQHKHMHAFHACTFRRLCRKARRHAQGRPVRASVEPLAEESTRACMHTRTCSTMPRLTCQSLLSAVLHQCLPLINASGGEWRCQASAEICLCYACPPCMCVQLAPVRNR